jgi:branched-chain amino acid transport system substrate-binding protein
MTISARIIWPGVKDVLRDQYDKVVIKTAACSFDDPTVQPQVDELRASGANVLITAAAGNIINPVIQQIYDTGWKPLHCVNYASAPSVASLRPIGPEKAVGLMDADWTWDPADPAAKRDPALEEWRASASKAMPDVDPADNADYIQAYVHCMALLHVLKRCGNDLSRQNIMRQAADLHEMSIPGMFPGIKINTSPTDYRAIRQMQMTRFNGKGWDFVGNVVDS